MKHLERAALSRDILRLAAAADLEIPGGRADYLALHLVRVLEANESFNLTSVTEPGAAVRLLAVDSLTALPEVMGAPVGDLVDMGSGAGFPGIPLAVTSGRHVRLVESNGKKARFLDDLAVEMESAADFGVSCARAEDLARSEPGAFGVATARALSGLSSLVELASPLLTPGGWLIAYKGALAPEELGRGDAAASRVGLERVSVRSLSLPEGGEARSIVVYAKVAAPEIALPRRVGLAQRKPLA